MENKTIVVHGIGKYPEKHFISGLVKPTQQKMSENGINSKVELIYWKDKAWKRKFFHIMWLIWNIPIILYLMFPDSRDNRNDDNNSIDRIKSLSYDRSKRRNFVRLLALHS